MHRQHDQRVRQDAEAAGRVVGECRVLLARAGGGETEECPLHAVDEPQPPRLPARTFEIAPAIQDAAELLWCHSQPSYSVTTILPRCLLASMCSNALPMSANL